MKDEVVKGEEVGDGEEESGKQCPELARGGKKTSVKKTKPAVKKAVKGLSRRNRPQR
ncbi:MAG: hypothetical protein U0X87_11395 [Anaerolineales bacterium]